MSTKAYLVVIERAARNCSAYSPDVSGCIATGATVEQTLTRMRRALRAHLAGLVEDGEPLPKARSLAWHLRNSRDFKPEPGDLFTQLPVELDEREPVLA